jgi:hypothetical protein
MNSSEARSAWLSHAQKFEEAGAYFPAVKSYLPEEWKRDYRLAMDAQPGLVTEANSAIPAMLTTMIDPQIFKILFSPNKATEILGEVRKGSWTDQTAMFPVVEHVGEVTSYGDYSESGHTGVNTNWPQRQSYLYQTIEEYGDLELERAGLARINWVSEIGVSAATVMNKYQNLSYFYGISGLQNYGLLNDPNLSASLTPATKNYGHAQWVYSGQVQASANEIYADIQALYVQLITQTGGLVDKETKMVLAMSPQSEMGLTATNAFNVNVSDLIKKNFPGLTIVTAKQYEQSSSTNNQGIAAGNMLQLLARDIEGQQTGYCAFNEKARAHPIIRQMSSYKQKKTGGTWGAIIRMPMAIASMIGV